MTDLLSYPSFRCVFEYLEANRRLHIASRSQVLRNTEKSIPLHLNELFLTEESITINNLSYGIMKFYETTEQGPPEGEQFTPGDIQFDSTNATWTRKYFFVQIENGYYEVDQPKRVSPVIRNIHVARKALANGLLGGRPPIHVDNLVVSTFDRGAIIRLPEGLKIQPRKFDTGDNKKEIILPILHAPWKLRFLDPSLELVNCPVAKSAKRFEMVLFDGKPPSWLLEFVKTLNNRNVLLEGYNIRNKDLIEIIKFWIENPKEIGTILKIDSCREDMGFDYYLEAIRGIFDVERREKYNIPYYSIPINSTSQLFLFEIPELNTSIFVMVVAPIDGSPRFVEPEPISIEKYINGSSSSDSANRSMDSPWQAFRKKHRIQSIDLCCMAILALIFAILTYVVAQRRDAGSH